MEQQLASILAKLAKLKILDEIKATALQQAADLRDCKASFDLATPTHTTCSTDGRGLDTDEDGSVDVVPELAAPVVCDAGHGVVAIDTTGLAAPTPLTCSTKCSNQVGATSFPSPVTTASLLPAATRELVADLVCPATNAVDLMQPFRKHDLDVSPPTRHEGLLLWPTPWPSFWMDHAEGNEVRPIPWPSFLIGRFLEHLILFVQVHDSGWISSTFTMELSHVGNLVCDLPGNCSQLLCLWSLQQDDADSCLNTHVKLPWLSIPCKCRAVKVWSELLNSEVTEDYYSSVAHFGSPVTISVDDVGLVEFIEHPFLIVHEHIIELASCFCLKKLWSTRDWWHHILEYAAVGGIHIPEKLHGTIQIIRMSVHWQFMSQEEFKRSGCVDRGCIGFTLGRAALTSFHINNSACSSEQFNDLLFHRARSMVKHNGSRQPCSSSAEVPYWFGSFISRSPQIFWAMYYKLEVELKPSWLLQFFISPSTSCFCLLVVSATASSATGLTELESLHVDTWFESVLSSGAAIPEPQLVNAIFQTSFWPERHVSESSFQVLVTGSQLQLFSSDSASVFLMGNFSEVGNQFKCQWRAQSWLGKILVLTWKFIARSVEQLPEATHSCDFSLHWVSRPWMVPWLEDGIGDVTVDTINHIGCLEFVYFRQVDLGTDSVILWNPEPGKEWTCLELKGWTTLNARTRNAKHQLHAYFSSDKQQCSGTYSSIPSAGGNHYQSVQSKGEEVPYLLRSWNDGVKQLSKEDMGIEFTIFMRNDLTRASMELLAYQLAGTIIAALILTIRSIRILAGITQAIHMEVTHRSFLGQYWSFNLSNEHNSHISVRDSWVLLIIHAGKDVTINIVGKLFLPWDPGVLGIVFEDIHGERNHPFGHQVMLTNSSSSLLNGVEFSTGYGQALFQGGRSIMVLHAFVDHHYHLDAFLNRDISYYLDGACFFDLAQVYFDNVHHRDYSSTKEQRVPWDPGGKGTASAWGQAEFQGGRIVSDPCSPLPHGWAGPWLYSWALACLGGHRSGYPDGSRHWRLALSFLAPLLPPLAPLLISFLATPCNPKHPYELVIPVNE